MYIGIGNRVGKVRSSSLIPIPSANTDIIQWNSIDTIPTSAAGYFVATTTGINKITKYRPDRVLGNGNVITQVKLHNMTKTNITSVVFYIYRYNGATYDRIYTEDVLAKLSTNNEVHTVTLATPQSLHEGDFIGNRWVSSSGTPNIAAGVNKAGAPASYYVAGAIPASPVDWDAKTANAAANTIHLMGSAPMIVGIGDSIMSCGPLHWSMLDTSALHTAVDPSKSWIDKLYVLDSRFTYQNCGIGGETTTQIEARFNRDVVLKKPKFAVINGGVNDFTAPNKATFLTKWTSMLDQCASNNIIPIVWKIMPWTAGSNAQMQTRDDWNASLVTLFETYDIPGKIIIDWDTDLGKFRAGGDAGNLWDIKAEYDQDFIHYNEAGNVKIAEVMLREIGKVFKLA